MIGNSAIGQYDSRSVWFFPTGFGNIITSDTFQDAGTCFSWTEALISVVSFTNPFLWSKPGAFFRLRFVRISSATYFGVISGIVSS
jgi:hypothetical protein